MKLRIDYGQALKLRMRGKTYGEIRTILNIPKSTQSYWFKKLKLPIKAQKTINEKQGRGFAALQVFNTKRTRSIQTENEEIKEYYEKAIGLLSKRDLTLIGVSLYWAEGYKNFKQKRGGYPYISFANSDPQMILIFIYFLEQILDIKRENMRGEVLIQPNLSSIQAFNYWHSITKIPKERLLVYKTISKSSNGKRPKNLLPYGTFQLKVRRRQEFFKIKGMIDGITKAKIGL